MPGLLCRALLGTLRCIVVAAILVDSCHRLISLEVDGHPSLQEYSDSVRELLRKALAGGPCDNMRLVCLGLEHERMHQETLSYMVTQQVNSKASRRVHCTEHV